MSGSWTRVTSARQTHPNPQWQRRAWVTPTRSGEYVPVEFLPELPPPIGARALPEYGPLPRPAPSPAPRRRRGAERRVQRGAPLPQVVVPRRAAGRAPEYVGEVDVGPARAVRWRRLCGHADAR